jgi:hypothetical protein
MRRGLDGFLLLIRPNAVFKVHRGRLETFRWRDSERETPLPIPNRAVKPLSADGTWRATARESRSPPVLSRVAPRGGSFSFGAVSSTPGGPSARVSEHSTENQGGLSDRRALLPRRPSQREARRSATGCQLVRSTPFRPRSAPELRRDRGASGVPPRRGRTACSHRREAPPARFRTRPMSRSRSLRRRRLAAALGYL